MGKEPENHLHDHEPEVERGADSESTSETGRRVTVSRTAVRMFVLVVV